MIVNSPSKPASLDILYKDEHYVAIHKLAGLLVHKSHIDKHNPDNAMHQLRNQLGQWVYPVHRLDRPTSGVLIFALSSEAARELEQQFSNRQVRKVYQAIVRGHVADEGTIDHALKIIADFKQHKKVSEKKAPQAAVTAYRCLGRMEVPVKVDKYPSSRYSLVELYPQTGRKHQLRRHLKHIHHPIIGDPKYGKSVHNRFYQDHFHSGRLLLAATELHFTHPFTGKGLVIKAELESSFQQLARLFVNQ